MIRRAERKNYKRLGIAAALLLLGVVLVFGLRIKEVTVSGSNRYTPQQIENILFSGRWGNNTILALINDKTKPHKQIPFVEDYKLVFHGPFKAEVIVYDKSIVGYVSYMSSYMYSPLFLFFQSLASVLYFAHTADIFYQIYNIHHSPFLQ